MKKFFAFIFLWLFGVAPLIGVGLMVLHLAQRGNALLMASEVLATLALWMVGGALSRRSPDFEAGVVSSLPARAIQYALCASFAMPGRVRRFASRQARYSPGMITRLSLAVPRRSAGRQSGASAVSRRSAAGSKSAAADGGDDGGEPPHRRKRLAWGGAA